MNSPAPAPSSTLVGNLLIVRMDPPDTAAVRVAPPAANDGVLADTRATGLLMITVPAMPSIPAAPTPTAMPAAAAGAHPRLPRVPLAIALAATFWMLGTLILLTFAIAYRLVA